MTEHIQLREADGVLEITFARPDKKNALSNRMYDAAREALERGGSSPSVRAILFSAEGSAFTAGNDVAEFASFANGQSSELKAHGFIEAISRAEKPLVAAVNGLAVGVGTTMLLHCDLVYIADTAKLSTPFVNLALVPEAASSLLLTNRIGYVRAFAMFALGESISGAEAVALGIANKLLPEPEVRPAAQAAAKALAAKPLGSLLATKRLMRDMGTIEARMKQEGVLFQQCLKSDDAREAFRAFAERRPPKFA
jgi:enoyl-CoA hydratase/carnithine racemase